MKRFILLIIATTLTACHFFENKKMSTKTVLKEELKTFNFNEVDTYPTFATCDTLIKKEALKTCFENTVLNHFNQFLQTQRFVVSEVVSDTIKLQLKVDKNGDLAVTSINAKPNTQQQLPQLDSLLTQSVKGLPKLYAAQKRSQPVTSVYTLPIVVSVQ